ncbi:peptidase S24 [Sphingomonas sp. KRR8]|uniref:S24 family peptidase n=1 Tax=Sphingomonas sp. KRR8 TaxID=2942996 RepID=UPI002021B5A5|nr:LexA family transcriptional regulator [Sphingomonas sp. KRR8]URD62067.1 peptidase S24 [Sphingomonas sp. KRR8]
MQNKAAAALERLCLERGDDFAGLSRMIGRNPAYIQQFVRRGIPKRLGEEERRLLARYFGVPESLLGGPEHDEQFSGMVRIPALPVRASAGPGAFADDERQRAFFAFDERWLKQLTGAARSELNLIRVEGDSMMPTLTDGDDILVDRSDAKSRLRDGIYVLRIEDVLMVKRLALHPIKHRVTVQSDNPAYADWPDCDPKDIDVIGRVIWSARRIA